MLWWAGLGWVGVALINDSLRRVALINGWGYGLSMEKKSATAKAKQTAQYGYFETSTTTGYLRCPICRQHTTAEKYAWEKWGNKLVAKLTEHLMEEH